MSTIISIQLTHGVVTSHPDCGPSLLLARAARVQQRRHVKQLPYTIITKVTHMRKGKGSSNDALSRGKARGKGFLSCCCSCNDQQPRHDPPSRLPLLGRRTLNRSQKAAREVKWVYRREKLLDRPVAADEHGDSACHAVLGAPSSAVGDRDLEVSVA